MTSLIETLGLKGNPFEHYTAETEPNITNYVVRPPYLKAISERVQGISSFILFGDRGAGKSATRITVFNDYWEKFRLNYKENNSGPFVVNFTDYTRIVDLLKSDRLSDRDIVSQVAFFVFEQLMVWLSSLEEEERDKILSGLNNDNRALIFALAQEYYLKVPDFDRDLSTKDALKLLNAAWTTQSALWIGKRWDALGAVIASIVSGLTKNKLGEHVEIEASANVLIQTFQSTSAGVPRGIMTRLVQLVQMFGFTGVVVLIDKLDETSATSNSAEATAKLIFPLLSHVQLLEVEGFAWMTFVWGSVRDQFNNKYKIRLDKIANAHIKWEESALIEMLESRIDFYSDKSKKLSDIFSKDVDYNKTISEIVRLASKSPREVIRLMDVIIREHDARDMGSSLIDEDTLTISFDKFSIETVESWFPEKLLKQIFKLSKINFVNKDVQTSFKISDQGARVKIKSWEDAGLVSQNGTSPSDMGGKPVYNYTVSDARVARIIERDLSPGLSEDDED